MSTTAVSSVFGEISSMLLTYPNANPLPDDVVLQRYSGIFHALGSNIQYVILAYPEVHQAIRNTASNAGLGDENLILVPADIAPTANVSRYIQQLPNDNWLAEIESPFHSIWAQDAYCILSDEDGKPIFLEPLRFARGGDHSIAEQVGAHTGIGTQTTRYHIEGGNVLCGSDFALIGKDYLHYSMDETNEDEQSVTEGLVRDLGVERIIWLGLDNPVEFPYRVFEGVYQPIFHIDMYVTLAGLADNGKPLILVGDTRMAKEILDQNPIPEVISDAFDETAEQLRHDLDCEIVRIPLDLWLDDDDNPVTGTFLTYNNCLIEVFGTQKNVYIPAYSSVSTSSVNRRELDARIEALFADTLKFNVTMMQGSYHELCKRGGSLHCITKTLSRRIDAEQGYRGYPVISRILAFKRLMRGYRRR